MHIWGEEHAMQRGQQNKGTKSGICLKNVRTPACKTHRPGLFLGFMAGFSCLLFKPTPNSHVKGCEGDVKDDAKMTANL